MKKLYDKCADQLGDGFAARDTAKDVIQGAFDEWSHNVSIELGDQKVYAPQENKGGPFEAYKPCTFDELTWNDLRDWWETWVEYSSCKDPHASGQDCHLLVTVASGGGLGASGMAVVGGSFQVAKELGGHEDHGDTEAHKKAKNIIHEVGHNLTNNMENQDDSSLAHDSARLDYHTDDGYVITAMGIVGDTTTNNCSDESYWYTNKRDNWDGSGWEIEYSPCTEDNVEARPR